MLEREIAERLPKFLESFEDLTGHFDEHFGELGSNDRGDTFLDLALKVISLTNEGQEFPQLRPSERKSHDGGVDLYTAETEDGRILCASPNTRLEAKTSSTPLSASSKTSKLASLLLRPRHLFFPRPKTYPTQLRYQRSPLQRPPNWKE